MYPNPAEDLMHLYFEQAHHEPLWLSIYDLSGQLMRIQEIPAGTRLHSTNLQDLKHGMYIIEVRRHDRKIVLYRNRLLTY